MKKNIAKIMALIICISCLVSSVPAYASKKITVYAPDGRTSTIWDYDLKAWKKVGWYEYPVTTMYAPDGRTSIIAKSAVKSWEKVGWYTYPVTTVYAPDGRVAVIAQSAVSDWIAVGWYTSPYISHHSMYYSTNIPTYTAITGISLADTSYYEDYDVPIYSYTFTSNNDVAKYVKTLCYQYGWSIQEYEPDYSSNSYYICLQKGYSLIGILLMYSVNQVEIFIID